jgi:hypothetical protein
MRVLKKTDSLALTKVNTTNNNTQLKSKFLHEFAPIEFDGLPLQHFNHVFAQ